MELEDGENALPFPSHSIVSETSFFTTQHLCWKEHSMFKGKNENGIRAYAGKECVPLSFRQVVHDSTGGVGAGRSCSGTSPPRSPSLALPILSTWVFQVLNSFRDYRMYPHHSSRSGLPDGCQCLDWRELERWISLSPPPQSSSGLSTPGFDLLPLMEPEFPIASTVPPPSPPSPNLPLSRPDGQTGASSNIDGNDAHILPCLPLPRAPHRIVNDATRLDGDGRIFVCLDSHGEIQLAVM